MIATPPALWFPGQRLAKPRAWRAPWFWPIRAKASGAILHGPTGRPADTCGDPCGNPCFDRRPSPCAAGCFAGSIQVSLAGIQLRGCHTPRQSGCGESGFFRVAINGNPNRTFCATVTEIGSLYVSYLAVVPGPTITHYHFATVNGDPVGCGAIDYIETPNFVLNATVYANRTRISLAAGSYKFFYNEAGPGWAGLICPPVGGTGVMTNTTLCNTIEVGFGGTATVGPACCEGNI